MSGNPKTGAMLIACIHCDGGGLLIWTPRIGWTAPCCGAGMGIPVAKGTPEPDDHDLDPSPQMELSL